MNYKHIILTRFNLQYELQNDVHIQPIWLDERFRLFEQYCLPSVINQTNQHFTWVILFSNQTPIEYRERIMEYPQKYKNICVEFCPYYADVNLLYKYIGEKYSQGYDYLLSTRIDNDDMLACNFVETLQQHINSQIEDVSIISFEKGIQWFEQKNIAFGVSYQRNHFLNFLEKGNMISTCLGVDHTKISTENLFIVEEPSMWCEIVHESNMLNDYVPKYKYSCKYKSHLYPIDFGETNSLKQSIFLLCKHIKFRYYQGLRFLKKVF